MSVRGELSQEDWLDELARSKAYLEGATAHRLGLTKGDNPYETGKIEGLQHREWLKGWRSRSYEPEQLSLLGGLVL